MNRKVLGCQIWALGFVTLTMTASPVNGTSCQDVIATLLPCQQFLMGNGEITVPCCEGAQELEQVALSKTERRDICLCLKQVVASMGDNLIKPERAKLLPQLCGISVPALIDPNIGCDNHIVRLNDAFVMNQKTQTKGPVTNAFSPTSPGHSPGIGHNQKPPSTQVQN